MTADINEHPAIGPDHQLPAHVPAHRRRVIWIVAGILMALVLVLVVVLILRHRDEAEKAAAAKRAAAAGITITSATAQKGNIGVYLDAIGTVTPVYSDSITSQVNGLITAVHYE